MLILISCESTSKKTKLWDIDVRGSWYTNLGERGMYDSLLNYAEVYVNDSTIWFQDEDHGPTSDQSYYIKGDTLFKCFGTGSECEFIPMYRLRKHEHDTLWLTVTSKYTNGTQIHIGSDFRKTRKDLMN